MGEVPIGFFTPEPALYHAGARGFALFGAGHLASLALSAALVALCIATYLRLPSSGAQPAPRRAALLCMSGTPVGLVAVKCASYLALGLFEPLFWPLHICNLCEFAALGYALSPNTRMGRRLGDLLFFWGMTGCAGALVLPGWHGYCPAWCFASLCGFVEHALVLACALCVLLGRDYVPDLRGVWFTTLVSTAGAITFRMLNPLLGTNFFFVTNPTPVGGPFPWMVRIFGDPGFLLPYLAMSVTAWLALCWLGRCVSFRHHA